MRRPVGAEAACLRQSARIAAVGLHLALTLGIHRRVVRVGDEDRVSKVLETPGHPLALGAGFDQDADPRVGPEHRGEAVALGPDATLDDLTVLFENADLTHPLPEIYGTMGHGWSSSGCALERVDKACGAILATTSLRGTSHFIPSRTPRRTRVASSPPGFHASATATR